MNSSLVSIVMPVYNCEDIISETLDCLLEQTYTNWELNAVDDCSTDRSAEIIKAYAEKDPRIRYFRLEKNSGAAVARTRSMAEANGKYLAFLDSDDYWLPEKLAKQIAFMEAGDYAFTCTDYAWIDEQGNLSGRVIKCRKKCSYTHSVWYNPIGNSTVILDKEKVGTPVVPDIRKRNDYALWLMLLRTKVDFAYGLQEILSYYRVREGSLSKNKIKLIKPMYKLFREVEHFSVVHAAFQTAMWCVIKVLHIK